MEIKRPDPEMILKDVEAAEEKEKRGRLRIFFGYAAGIGKTYSMLRSARKRAEEGVDVVIGYLEPHARPETTALSEGLEIIPERSILYNHIMLREMDVDAILARKPELVLVDEYAHTNAAGSRHEKRYQDVEELLAEGIDVYTTVNVQHIESLCDIVASITGIIVRERIPDYAFDLADEIKLVDTEPKNLMRRLAEGKVYRSEQAGRALSHFFTVEKLTALREIALRRMANRVNLLTEQTKKETGRHYYTEEKILVGISPSPSNPRIIRTAARMAQAFGGIMIGLYVETPESARFSPENKKRLRDNIQLAGQLGAKIETVLGEDVPFIIAEYAKNGGISKIVAGRSVPYGGWGGWIKKATFVDKLIQYAPDMDIYIIPDNHEKHKGQERKSAIRNPLQDRCIWKTAVFAGTIAGTGGLLYYLGCGEGAIIIFGIISIAALIIGTMLFRLKEQSRELVRSAERTKIILEMTQQLQQQTGIDEIRNTMARELGRLLNRSVVLYGTVGEKLKSPRVFPVGDESDRAEQESMLTENEEAVARWVYRNKKHAGATTDTLHNAQCFYLPIRSPEKVYGVIGIEIGDKEGLSAFEYNVITSIIYETATVIERDLLRTEDRKSR